MGFQYGFTMKNQRLVIHLAGEDKIENWKIAFNDPRYKPGQASIVGFVGNQTVIGDFIEFTAITR